MEKIELSIVKEEDIDTDAVPSDVAIEHSEDACLNSDNFQYSNDKDTFNGIANSKKIFASDKTGTELHKGTNINIDNSDITYKPLDVRDVGSDPVIDKVKYPTDSDFLKLPEVTLQKKRGKRKDTAGDDGNVRDKVYTCDECGKVFHKSKGLAGHRITHMGKSPFTCVFCDKGFYVRSNLTAHMRIHTGQKPFECEICQKSFTQNGQLKQHRRIHSGELPYTCPTCSKAFRNSSALVTHRRIHTGEKPYRCDICSRSFSTSTSLKTHRVTHSGEMLFECPLCKREFNRRNNLNVHIKRHNKDRSFSCPLCHNGFVMRAHLFIHLKRSHKIDVKDKGLKDIDSIFLDKFYSIPNDSSTKLVNSPLESLDTKQNIDDTTFAITDGICANPKLQNDLETETNTCIKVKEEIVDELVPEVVIENVGGELTDKEEASTTLLRVIKKEPDDTEMNGCENNASIIEHMVVHPDRIKTEPPDDL